MVKFPSSAWCRKHTISPTEADNMWLNGGATGKVCLRVSYVTKNIAASKAGKSVSLRNNQERDGTQTTRGTPNDNASHTFVNAPEAPSIHEALGRL